MAITYHPPAGAILICDYDTGFVAPEMVKRRPIVVITPRLRRRDGLCTIVPLSTTEPRPAEDYHHKITLERPLPRPWASPTMWAKCDMLATVGYQRLSPIGVGRNADGRRRYIYPLLTTEDLSAIRRGVLCALSLKHLTDYL